MRAQAQSWVMPNVFNVGNVAKRLIWTRMMENEPPSSWANLGRGDFPHEIGPLAARFHSGRPAIRETKRVFRQSKYRQDI
jgi:hypothetical protein